MNEQTTSDVNPASEPSLKEHPASPILRAEYAETAITRLIELQTAKIPSHVFLATALAAMAVSVTLEIAGRVRLGRFIGLWPAPLLIMGVYNKVVKVTGPR